MPHRSRSSSPEAEKALAGRPATMATYRAAAEQAMKDAKGYGHNDFKIALARRTVVRALKQAAAGTPQSQTDKRVA